MKLFDAIGADYVHIQAHASFPSYTMAGAKIALNKEDKFSRHLISWRKPNAAIESFYVYSVETAASKKYDIEELPIEAQYYNREDWIPEFWNRKCDKCQRM